jgi:tetratricopeptide (TPR) repeat protein
MPSDIATKHFSLNPSPRPVMSSPFRHHPAACLLVTLTLALPSHLAADDSYKTFNEAFAAGMKLLREQQFAAAQAPLEAALKLAADDQQRMKTYQALVPAYRQLPEIDKMLEAQEFVIRHSERRTERSRAARDLASFLHQRGKTDVALARYDAAFQASAKDPAALGMLAVIYTRTKPDAQRGEHFTKMLETLDKHLAGRLAQRLEKDAESAPQTAATILKDAATAWVEAGDHAKALAAAKKSLASLPEDRGELNAYFWRRGLGDVFLAAGEPAEAVKQLEAALAVVKIDGYRKDTEKQLAEAKAAAAKKP